MYIYIYIYTHLFVCLSRWRYLSNATCLIRPSHVPTCSAHKPASVRGEPLVQLYLSNACSLQTWRMMQQIKLAVLDK